MSKLSLEPASAGRRLTQRGAVTVEGLIVIVMMTVVVMCTWFTRQMFAGKLLTLTEARADAWNYALKGCDNSSALGDVYKQLHEQSKDTTKNICTDPNDCSSGNSDVEGLKNDGDTTTPPSWYPTGAGTPGTKSMIVAVDAAYSTTVSTTVDFACNPEPHDELDLGAGLTDAVNQILKIPDEEVNPEMVSYECWQNYYTFPSIHWQKANCEDCPFNVKSRSGASGVGPLCVGDSDPDPKRTWSHKDALKLNDKPLP